MAGFKPQIFFSLLTLKALTFTTTFTTMDALTSQVFDVLQPDREEEIDRKSLHFKTIIFSSHSKIVNFMFNVLNWWAS